MKDKYHVTHPIICTECLLTDTYSVYSLWDKCRNSKKENPHFQTEKSGLTVCTPMTEMTLLSFESVAVSDFNNVNSKDDYISSNSEDKANIRLSTLKKIADDTTELEGAPQYANSTVDLNDSQLELEKILLPSTVPNSGSTLSMENFKFNAKLKDYHAEAACATPTKLFVKSHSFGDLLHDTKLAGSSRPELNHNTGSSRLYSNHRATSAVSSTKELHLRQKHLQKRVSLAHQDWNNNNLQHQLSHRARGANDSLQQVKVVNIRQKDSEMKCMGTLSGKKGQKQRKEATTEDQITKQKINADTPSSSAWLETTATDVIPSKYTSVFYGQQEHRHNENTIQMSYF